MAELQALADSRKSDIDDLARQVSSLGNERRGILDERQRPPSKDSVMDSAVYKGLQTQYTVAVQEIGQVRIVQNNVSVLIINRTDNLVVLATKIKLFLNS